MSGHRRTLYTTDDEERLLNELSLERSTSVNTIIRISLRLLLGMPVPSWAYDLQTKNEEKELVR